MPQQENLPINEPGLLGVSQGVTVGDPTGTVALPFDPPSMQRRLWVLYPLASLSISAISGGVNSSLLAKLFANVAGLGKLEQAAVLGLALSISGITYLIAAPIGGLLSDKTRTRFLGRRNIWILGGAIASSHHVDRPGTRFNGSCVDSSGEHLDDSNRCDPRGDERDCSRTGPHPLPWPHLEPERPDGSDRLRTRNRNRLTRPHPVHRLRHSRDSGRGVLRHFRLLHSGRAISRSD